MNPEKSSTETFKEKETPGEALSHVKKDDIVSIIKQGIDSPIKAKVIGWKQNNAQSMKLKLEAVKGGDEIIITFKKEGDEYIPVGIAKAEKVDN